MDDLFIVSKKEIEESDFGDCKYDVMEVSVYDISNNLLPQKSGNNVAYIKSGDIKNYMYSLTNQGGQSELAIDIEKLLKDLGFSNSEIPNLRGKGLAEKYVLFSGLSSFSNNTWSEEFTPQFYSKPKQQTTQI